MAVSRFAGIPGAMPFNPSEVERDRAGPRPPSVRDAAAQVRRTAERLPGAGAPTPSAPRPQEPAKFTPPISGPAREAYYGGPQRPAAAQQAEQQAQRMVTGRQEKAVRDRLQPARIKAGQYRDQAAQMQRQASADALPEVIPVGAPMTETPMRQGARPDTVAGAVRSGSGRGAAELQSLPMNQLQRLSPAAELTQYNLPQGSARFQGQAADSPGGVSMVPGRTADEQRRINERVSGIQKAIYDNMVARGMDPISRAARNSAGQSGVIRAQMQKAAQMSGSQFANTPGSLANVAIGATADIPQRMEQMGANMESAVARDAQMRGLGELPEFQQAYELQQLQQQPGGGLPEMPAWRQTMENDLVKRYNAQIAAIPESQQTLAAFQQMYDALESGDVTTGPYRSILAEMDRYSGGMFGAANAKDAFTAMTNLANLSGTKQLLTGVITDRDLMKIEEAGLRYGNDPEVNKEIARFYMNAIQRGVDRANAMREWMGAGNPPSTFPEEQFQVQLESDLGLPPEVLDRINTAGQQQGAGLPGMYQQGNAYADSPSALAEIAGTDPFGGDPQLEAQVRAAVMTNRANPRYAGMTDEQIEDLTMQQMGL